MGPEQAIFRLRRRVQSKYLSVVEVEACEGLAGGRVGVDSDNEGLCPGCRRIG